MTTLSCDLRACCKAFAETWHAHKEMLAKFIAGGRCYLRTMIIAAAVSNVKGLSPAVGANQGDGR